MAQNLTEMQLQRQLPTTTCSLINPKNEEKVKTRLFFENKKNGDVKTRRMGRKNGDGFIFLMNLKN